MRVASGVKGLVYTGADMGALLAMTRASGVPDPLAVEIVPDLAATAARKMNEQGHG